MVSVDLQKIYTYGAFSFKAKRKQFKVSVNENFSTLLDFVFLFYFWHEWVLNFILVEKENQKVLFNLLK